MTQAKLWIGGIRRAVSGSYLRSALGTLPCLEVFRDEGDGGSSLASPHTWEPVYAHVTTLRSIVAVAREVPGAQGASDLASLSRLSQLTALDVNANRTRALRDLADAPASLRTLRVANAVLGDVLELSALARLTGLTSLTLDGVGGPGGGPASAALSVLTALTGLRELRVLHFLGDVATEVCDSDGGLQCPARLVVPGGIVGALPSLERVQMVGCGASRGLLRDLGRARCLASVDLTGCALVDEGGAGEGDAPLPCAGPAVPLAGCGVLDEFVRAQQGGTGAVRHLVLAKVRRCMRGFGQGKQPVGDAHVPLRLSAVHGLVSGGHRGPLPPPFAVHAGCDGHGARRLLQGHLRRLCALGPGTGAGSEGLVVPGIA